LRWARRGLGGPVPGKLAFAFDLWSMFAGPGIERRKNRGPIKAHQ